MKLRLLPLADFKHGREAWREARRRDAAQMDRDNPGWREEFREVLKSPRRSLAEILEEGLKEADEAYGPSRSRERLEEYDSPHSIQWDPFFAQGRHSPDGTWHVSWGKVGNEEYRVALCLNGELRLWLEPSARVVDGWVADNGLFAVKDFTGDDEVTFAFADEEGSVFHRWTRPWRFLKFLRFDADGLGYVYVDETGRTEVRFDIASLGE
jgi:hypothetical protein